MKVLIVEDNKISRVTISNYLKGDDYELIICSNGEEAFQKWEEENPEVLITDIQMPKMDGMELITKIRNQPSSNYTFIIVVTSHKDEETFRDSFELGADDFILKPFSALELKSRLLAAKRVVALQEKKLLLYSLGQMIEVRDADTGAHIERVGAYSKVIAVGLKEQGYYYHILTRAYIDNLELSATLHDIGKIGVPDEILRKPGKYTIEEYEKMKEHTIIGHEIIEKIRVKYPRADFLEIASEVAYGHHERYDGSGYPQGIKGEKIPLSARIVILADIYDALRTKRVYKNAYSHQETKEYIINNDGIFFDPLIVQAFLKTEQQFEKIYQSIN